MEWTRFLEGSRFRRPQLVRVTIMEEAMSRTILARFLGMIGLAATMAGPLAWAQDAPLVRVRGQGTRRHRSEADARRQAVDRRPRQGITFRHQTGLVRGGDLNAAGGRQ